MQTVNTGWRNVTPGPCTFCGSDDDYDCDGRGNVYCSCQTCAECGMFDGHEIGCKAGAEEAENDECALAICGVSENTTSPGESLATESDLTTLIGVREWIGEALPLTEAENGYLNWDALECAADILLSQATTLRRIVAEKRRAAVEGLTCLNCNGTERPCCDAPRFDPDSVACVACNDHGCIECE